MRAVRPLPGAQQEGTPTSAAVRAPSVICPPTSVLTQLVSVPVAATQYRQTSSAACASAREMRPLSSQATMRAQGTVTDTHGTAQAGTVLALSGYE